MFEWIGMFVVGFSCFVGIVAIIVTLINWIDRKRRLLK